MPNFRGAEIKIRCERCIGWGKISWFEHGEQVTVECPDCEARGWNATRLLVLVERQPKPPKPPRRPGFKSKKHHHWSQLPGVPEGF